MPWRLLTITALPFPFGAALQAAAIVLVMSVLLSLGVRESAWFISGAQGGLLRMGWGHERRCTAGGDQQPLRRAARMCRDLSCFFPPFSGVTVFKLVLLVFIAIVGYVQGTWDNAEPFIDPSELLTC